MDRYKKAVGAIRDITEEIKRSTDLQTAIQKIANISKELMGCSSCSIWIISDDEKKLLLKGAAGRHNKRNKTYFYEQGEGIIWSIYSNNIPLMLSNASGEDGLRKRKYLSVFFPEIAESGGPFLGVPIGKEGELTGVLAFGSYNPNFSFEDKNLDFAQLISNEIVLLVDKFKSKYRTLEIEYLRKEKYEFLYEFNNSLLSCNTLDEVLNLATTIAIEKLSCRSASVFLFSKTGDIERYAMSGLYSSEIPHEVYHIGEGIIGEVFLKRNKFSKLIYCNEFKSSKYKECKKTIEFTLSYEKYLKSIGLNEEINHMAIAPLNGVNRTFGVLRIINKIDKNTKTASETPFSNRDKEWLQIIASLLSSAIANIKKQDKLNVMTNLNSLYKNDTSYHFFRSEKEFKIFEEVTNIITNEKTIYSAAVIRCLDERGENLKIIGCPKIYIKMILLI